MECKEEATRAKAIAEEKFSEADIVGTKRFVVKAHALFPDLEGLRPSADNETIWEQYRRLAFILHPIKNKPVGAESAYQILSKAWSELSNKAERTDFEQNCSQKPLPDYGVDLKGSPITDKNGFLQSYGLTSVTQRGEMLMDQANLSTFWTICDNCKVQVEYNRDCLNRQLLCQNCCHPFFAVEIPRSKANRCAVPVVYKSSIRGQHTAVRDNGTSLRSSGSGGMSATDKSGFSCNMYFDSWKPVSSAKEISDDPLISELLKKKIQKAPKKLRKELFKNGVMKKEMVCGLAAGSFYDSSNSEVKDAKRSKTIVECNVRQQGKNSKKKMVSTNGGLNCSGPRSFHLKAVGIFSGAFSGRRDPRASEFQKLLMMKAKRGIKEKLHEWGITSATKMYWDMNKQASKTSIQALENGFSIKQLYSSKKSVKHASDYKNDAFGMCVPDSDFHNFDKDRVEKSFGKNQIWAVYDDDDGMPRYYAMIHGVISRKPFKMKISWLNSKSNREYGSQNWIGSGFCKTSGEFWMGKHAINGSLTSFSHRIEGTKGVRGAVYIYPKTGQVWALYTNWSSDWNQFTSDAIVHKYEMVEVIDDYNEETGVKAVPLVKVAGFKAVFRRHSDPSTVRTIQREEMFRMSHQVPSCSLTGKETGLESLDGCIELDPASLPLELLQTISESPIDNKLNLEEDKMTMKESESVKDGRKRLLEEVCNRTYAGGSMQGRMMGTKEGTLLVYKRRRHSLT